MYSASLGVIHERAWGGARLHLQGHLEQKQQKGCQEVLRQQRGQSEKHDKRESLINNKVCSLNQYYLLSI